MVLDHEKYLSKKSANVSVKDAVIVVVTSTQGQEVVARLRTLLAEELQLDVPNVSV